ILKQQNYSNYAGIIPQNFINIAFTALKWLAGPLFTFQHRKTLKFDIQQDKNQHNKKAAGAAFHISVFLSEFEFLLFVITYFQLLSYLGKGIKRTLYIFER